MKNRLKCSALGVIVLMAYALATIPDHLSFGQFQPHLAAAQAKLQTMSQDEKMAQILLVRYPGEAGAAALREYQFGGYLFFAKDFAGKDTAAVQQMMVELQEAAKIPLLTAVDEEGGLVVRVSSNPQLAAAPFKSPQELYRQGGFEAIRADTLGKSRLLSSLGINLNLAPVVDVSTNPHDYMHSRSLGENTELTAEYARTVIEASKAGAVSYTLKHFPGYGNNTDTHAGASIDRRTYDEIMKNDLPPFAAGIQAGAEAVLVSHNVVSSIDPDLPASLSPAVHRLLRDQLKFRGVIITDDIAMGALADLPDTTVQALLAGNDIIITTDYRKSLQELRTALGRGAITSAQLDQAVLRVLAWKYHKGMIID